MMNAAERKELKRAQEGLENWRAKATGRAKDNYFLREKINDLQKSRASWRAKVESLEAELKKRSTL